jgi:hypothetical protein
MSLQITTGYGSLVALGFGAGDAASLLALGQRIGNWLTAESEDRNFLQMLELDEVSIFQRRGLLDITSFNKVWGSQMTIFVNNKPTVFRDEDAKKSLKELSRFTAIMVCATAALEAFAMMDVVKSALKNVLRMLLSTSEYGEDILSSSLPRLLNGWRSMAEVRGLSYTARLIRRELLDREAIVDGLIPAGDSRAMENFLVWLFAGEGETYTTASSDIAGVGLCLSKLGIDILSVAGLGEEPAKTRCRLNYDREAISELRGHGVLTPSAFRVTSTTVNLKCPKESLTKFPAELKNTANRSRSAWAEGESVANKVACYLKVPDPTRPELHEDLYFVFVDRGSEQERADDAIHDLASAHAFHVNREILDGLDRVFQHEERSTLKWILDQTVEVLGGQPQILDPGFTDHVRISAFTVFQAFFMGYYYAIFLRLVDTSMLQLETVDGAWGFRSPEFLSVMRTRYLAGRNVAGPGNRIVGRETVISILSTLLLSVAKAAAQTDRNTFNKDSRCVGVIGRRALLVRSLVSPCSTLRDIGSFVLLDSDVSGIPRNNDGLVRPGLSDVDLHTQRGFVATQGNHFRGTCSEDVTFHIEPDWDVDPTTMLLCIRYKGRRITTINPSTADMSFCHSLVPPVSNPKTKTELRSEVINWTATDVLNRKDIPSSPHAPILARVANHPRLRYAAVAILSPYAHVRLATNCLEAAIERGRAEAKQRRLNTFIIAAGDETECLAKAEDWLQDHERRKQGWFGPMGIPISD